MQARMIISRSDIIERGKRSKIFASNGVIVFRKMNIPLYYLKTNDLDKLLSTLFKSEFSSNSQRKMLQPVLTEFDFIECYPVANELEALVTEKRLLLQETPEFHNKIRLYDQYPYFSLNIQEPPYLSVKEDTVDNSLYTGPFADRFFLVGVINAFNSVVSSPACPDDKFPCSLYTEKRCPAYCLKEDKQELIAIMKKHLIVINRDLVNSISQQRKQREGNLEFEKELELQKTQKTIEKYYQYLLFFHIIKHLNDSFTFSGVKYTIHNGLLESRSEGNRTEYFSEINNYFEDYEERELLALPKDTFREMWIIFKNFSILHPEKVDEIYTNSLLSIQKSDAWRLNVR